MNNEEKESAPLNQIEKDAEEHTASPMRQASFKAGAISQNNKVIDEITKKLKEKRFSSDDYNGQILYDILESLKITDK